MFDTAFGHTLRWRAGLNRSLGQFTVTEINILLASDRVDKTCCINLMASSPFSLSSIVLTEKMNFVVIAEILSINQFQANSFNSNSHQSIIACPQPQCQSAYVRVSDFLTMAYGIMPMISICHCLTPVKCQFYEAKCVCCIPYSKDRPGLSHGPYVQYSYTAVKECSPLMSHPMPLSNKQAK